MGVNDDQLSQAQHSIGFYRVALETDAETRFSSSYLAAGAVASECSTRLDGYTFIVMAWPARFAPRADRRSAHAGHVNVYLDGLFLEQSSWQRTEDAWVAAVHVNTQVQVTVSVVGRIRELPADLALTRDAPPLQVRSN
ncbi:hypothetical protein RN51_00155 [Microbacterium oxydans]|jgi:hypothetical protein|uniref:Uncharacterized protein n=1 Tax=Microbacterium oxydans TaxID=82380 RepID=A0A0F0L085_9MICO|nr:hypothetical protein [Microbacterium oxydans]KJL26513.1 hypothetical protein RN51_00155 [Microbacterium oxydans]